jgi:hypothetical protein
VMQPTPTTVPVGNNANPANGAWAAF